METSRRARTVRIVVLAATALLVAGAVWRGPGEAAAPEAGKRRVAVVLSVGGRGDGSFNDMAYEGLMRARHELGIVATYGEPAAMSEDERYLDFYASEGFDLVVAVGFLMASALERVAAQGEIVRSDFIHPNARGYEVASRVLEHWFREADLPPSGRQ